MSALLWGVEESLLCDFHSRAENSFRAGRRFEKVQDTDIILEQNRGGCLLEKQARLPTRVEVGGREFVVEPVCPFV